MPHNLYLHSRSFRRASTSNRLEGKREAIKFATLDSTVALMFALFINAAIPVVALPPFTEGHSVAEIQDRHKLLAPVLGVRLASTLFAWRCWLPVRIHAHARWPADRDGRLSQYPPPPWLRRLITRLIAIVPALSSRFLRESGTAQLIVSARSCSACNFPSRIPLTYSRLIGERWASFANPTWLKLIAC